jgi:hypothetical protein
MRIHSKLWRCAVLFHQSENRSSPTPCSRGRSYSDYNQHISAFSKLGSILQCNVSCLRGAVQWRRSPFDTAVSRMEVNFLWVLCKAATSLVITSYWYSFQLDVVQQIPLSMLEDEKSGRILPTKRQRSLLTLTHPPKRNHTVPRTC